MIIFGFMFSFLFYLIFKFFIKQNTQNLSTKLMSKSLMMINAMKYIIEHVNLINIMIHTQIFVYSEIMLCAKMLPQ